MNDEVIFPSMFGLLVWLALALYISEELSRSVQSELQIRTTYGKVKLLVPLLPLAVLLAFFASLEWFFKLLKRIEPRVYRDNGGKGE